MPERFCLHQPAPDLSRRTYDQTENPAIVKITCNCGRDDCPDRDKGKERDDG